MALKCRAFFSNRVAIRLHSFRRPTQRSTTFRSSYFSSSQVGGRPVPLPMDFRAGITDSMFRSRHHCRIHWASYALSPATASGRLRGRPVGCMTRIWSISGSKKAASCRCPPVMTAASGSPRPSQARWIFEEKPPRPYPSPGLGRSSSTPGSSRQIRSLFYHPPAHRRRSDAPERWFHRH